jgi:hypothetical protein
VTPAKKKAALLSFRARVVPVPGLAGTFGLEVPAAVIASLPTKFKTRFVCVAGRGKLKFQCGLMPLGQGRGYIFLSKKRREALGVSAGSAVDLVLTPDKSRYGLEVPKELKELLRQDAEARRRFKGLTPGKQRNIIYYVSQAKSTAVRVERAIQLMENVKRLAPGKEQNRDIFSKSPVGAVHKEVKRKAVIRFEDL